MKKYNDRIIYCSDLKALKKQLIKDGHYNEETKSFCTGCILTPIKKNGNKSLTLARVLKLDLKKYKMLKDLGTYYTIRLKKHKSKLNKYKSVYPYDKPIKHIDSKGREVYNFRPFKIGSFL